MKGNAMKFISFYKAHIFFLCHINVHLYNTGSCISQRYLGKNTYSFHLILYSVVFRNTYKTNMVIFYIKEMEMKEISMNMMITVYFIDPSWMDNSY